MALSACNTETDSAGRELTVHGTAAFPIACYHDDLEAAPVPWHWHEELELLIASEGGVLAAAAGEKYTLAEGDGLFINAGVLHADWPLAVGRCRLHSVVFHPRLVGGSPDSVFWQKYLQPLPIRAAAWPPTPEPQAPQRSTNSPSAPHRTFATRGPMPSCLLPCSSTPCPSQLILYLQRNTKRQRLAIADPSSCDL